MYTLFSSHRNPIYSNAFNFTTNPATKIRFYRKQHRRRCSADNQTTDAVHRLKIEMSEVCVCVWQFVVFFSLPWFCHFAHNLVSVERLCLFSPFDNVHMSLWAWRVHVSTAKNAQRSRNSDSACWVGCIGKYGLFCKQIRAKFSGNWEEIEQTRGLDAFSSGVCFVGAVDEGRKDGTASLSTGK